MWKHLKQMVLALLCLLFADIAFAEPYYRIQVISESPYRFRYVIQNNPAPVLIGRNQALVTTGVAPPVVQYYVRRQVGARNVFRYVKAVPNPVIPAANQSIVTNPSTLSVQQAFANQTPPPGTPTPPPPTAQPPQDTTPRIVQNVPTPNFIVTKFCAEAGAMCRLPTTGVRPNPTFTVWFGTSSKWHKKTFQTGDVLCDNASFGGAPTPAYKRCFFLEDYYLDRTVLDNAGANLAPFVNNALNAPPAVAPRVQNTLLVRPAGIPPSRPFPAGGEFRIPCHFAFQSNDDPIVFPGVTNATHHHTFFGNNAVNAFSTNDSLRASGGSTCAGGIANRSGYWTPSLIDTSNGRPMPSTGTIVYYKTQEGNATQHTKAPPKGLRMITGKARPLSISETSAEYMCQDLNNNVAPNWGILWQGPTIQACGGNNVLFRMIITFPQCWDGVNLDSPDHISHMAFSCGNECEDANGNIGPSFNNCPASHPVLIPQVAINVDYSNLDITKTYRLSSDNYSTSVPGGYSLHADWMNGWDESIMNRIVQNCHLGRRDCGVNNLGDGQELFGFDF